MTIEKKTAKKFGCRTPKRNWWTVVTGSRTRFPQPLNAPRTINR